MYYYRETIGKRRHIMVFSVFMYIIAGLGAGIATGFSGISAAVIVTPILVTFCGFHAYEATAIAMASDVIASAATALNFARHGNVRFKTDTWILMGTILAFTVVGSWVAKYVPSPALGGITIVTSFLMGLKFLFFPKNSLNKLLGEQSRREILVETTFVGMAIGAIAGFAGAGGGEMTLFALTTILGYEIKEAVGTGVFVMTFIALVGGVSHMIGMGSLPDTTALIICVAGNFLGAVVASRIANKTSNKVLNRVIGWMLSVLGIIMIFANLVF